MNQLSAQVSIDVKVAVAALDKLGNAVSNFTAQFQQEVNQTAKGADKLEKEFVEVGRDAQKMATEVKKATAPLDKLQSELAQTAVAASKTGDALDRKLSKGSKGATQTLIGFNRVVQDAPFGIIGIANNIDPLLESFGRLKASTGSVGGALKALGGAFLGPSGILFLVSAASSLAIVAVQKYGSLGNAFDVLTGRTKALTEEQKKFREEQQQTQESIFKQRIETEQLVKVARGDIGSKAEQEAALRKLNSAIPDYIGVLNQQNIKTSEGITIIDKYVNALEKQAIAELLVNRVASLSVKRLDEEQRTRERLTDNLKRQADIRAQLDSVENQRGDAGAISRAALRTQLIETQKGFEEIIEAFESGRKGINSEIDRLRKEIDKNTVIIDPSKDTKEDKDNFKKYLQKLIKDYELTARATPTKVELPMEIVALPSGIEIATGRVQRLSSELNSQVNTILATTARPLEYKPKVIVKPDIDNKELEKEIEGLNSAFKSAIEGAVSGIGESIGESLAKGQDAIRSLAAGFMGAIGGLIQAIGKALIQYGTAKAGLDKVVEAGFSLPGVAAIAIGAAAVALGALVKNAFPKFANGGIVTGPTIGMIGEGGQPEVILPLSKINQFLDGGGSGVGRLEAVVSGDSLRFILERNKRKQSRVI